MTHSLHSFFSDTSPGELVPILVPLASFGAMVFVVAIALYYRYRRDAGRLEVARFLAEKDKAIPERLFGPEPVASKPASDLKRGFILVAAGVGLSIAAEVAGVRQAVGFGFIPGLIGLAYIAVWRIQRGVARERGEG